ncbi:UBX domain-containing protein [Chloropicon primus]|nr:UBX domain-containing protein [Chloropicon primus]
MANGSNLNTSVLSRLNKVERELKQAKECIRRKDDEIRELKAQLRDGQRGTDAPGSRSDDSMKQYVSEMRAEIAEMKAFLNDYGMVWIGGQKVSSGWGGSSSSDARAGGQANGAGASSSRKEITLPKENIRLLEKSVKELNEMMGEERSAKKRERVTLKVFKDGISFNRKPFRPYSDKTAQLVIRDLIDGYFPQELKGDYPEGVKILLVVNDDQTYEQSTVQEEKPAVVSKPKPKPRSNIRQLGNLDDKEEEEASTESFLEKVPKTVIQNGKIVQMREEIGSLVHLEEKVVPEKTAIHSLFTQKLNMAALAKLDEDLSEEEEDEGREEPKTVIQIKREDGMQTYVLKLPYWATIRDVRKALNSHRQDKGGKDKYVLRSAFPPQIYNDERKTLEEAGLVPNATLFMMKQNS